MTTSRSLPVDPEGEPLPPVFPMLPFALMAYAEQGLRGYADQAHTDETWDAEEALGLRILGEMNQAFLAMVLAPFSQATRSPRD